MIYFRKSFITPISIVVSVSILLGALSFFGNAKKVMGSEEKDAIIATMAQPYTAVVTISGMISSGPDMYEDITNRLQQAFYSPQSKEVVIRLSTFGGPVTSCAYIASLIKQYKLETGKKVYIYCMDMNASAGYYISCACDGIIANNDATLVGSIGVIKPHVNYHDFLKSMGIIVQMKSSSANKSGAMFLDPKDPDYAKVLNEEREELEKLANDFAQTVIQSRGSKLKLTREQLMDAKLYAAKDALKHGMIDDILLPADFAEKYCNNRLFIEMKSLEDRKGQTAYVYLTFSKKPIKLLNLLNRVRDNMPQLKITHNFNKTVILNYQISNSEIKDENSIKTTMINKDAKDRASTIGQNYDFTDAFIIKIDQLANMRSRIKTALLRNGIINLNIINWLMEDTLKNILS